MEGEFAREPEDNAKPLFSQSDKGNKGDPDIYNAEDMNGEGDKDEPVEPDHRYLGNVEEAKDHRAELHKPLEPTWSIDNAKNDRMVYVPKDTVMEFMKTVELESNRRIDRYKIYA